MSKDFCGVIEPKRGGPRGEGDPFTCSIVTGGTCTVSDAMEVPPVAVPPVEESKLVFRLLLGGVLVAAAGDTIPGAAAATDGGVAAETLGGTPTEFVEGAPPPKLLALLLSAVPLVPSFKPMLGLMLTG